MRWPATIHSCLPFVLLAALTAGKVPPADFGFGPPEVVKLDWSTRALTPGDLNGDGLEDLAVINNDAGKIEMLYQLPQEGAAREQKKAVDRSRWEPVLEDARFEKHALTVGFSVFDMIVHDLDGDERLDLAYTSGEVPLTVRHQNEEGEWVDSREYDGFEAVGWTNSIKASDVDKDGTVELFVLTSEAIRVYRQGMDGALGEPQLYYTSGENPFNMMLFDATGDGLDDLLYLSTDGKQVLAMRRQIADGQFGPEVRHVMERPARMIVPLELYHRDAPTLGVVNSRSGSLEFIRLLAARDGGPEAKFALQSGSPEIYPLFRKVRQDASYALGDMDGDGEKDLVVSNPEEAELIMFMKNGDRFKASKEFPSFSAVSSLSSGRFFDRETDHLIVLSEEEKTMGLSGLEASGRLFFPKQIKIGSGSPVVTAVADTDGDDYDELLLVNEDKGNYSLVVAAPVDRHHVSDSWDVLFEMELDGVRRKPFAVSTIDVFDSNRPGLVIFVPREPPVLLAPTHTENKPAFEPIAAQSSIRESLLKDLSPAQISVFDVDGDRSGELVVARTGFARAFKVMDGQLEMVDQFNARRGGDLVDAVIPLYSGSEINDIALYVSEERELQFLKRGANGVFRYHQSVRVGRLALQDWYRLPGQGAQAEDAYLFAGEDRFWYFNDRSRGLRWVAEDVYETELKDIHYSHLAGADFNLDTEADLVAMDGSEHVVDIISMKGGEFRSRMFWKVFEQNMHYQGRTGAKLEPRQVVIADLTGDELLDLALLVHDRILIYPQQ